MASCGRSIAYYAIVVVLIAVVLIDASNADVQERRFASWRTNHCSRRMSALLLISVATLCFSPVTGTLPNMAPANAAQYKESAGTSMAPTKYVSVLGEDSEKPKLEQDFEKRAAYTGWKRAGSYLNTLENALGSIQRPRFGKRFPYDESMDDGSFYNDKRGSSLLEMESALSSLQRPRFGRSANMKSRVFKR